MDAPPIPRPAAVAGLFYAGDADTLRAMVDTALEDAAPRVTASVPDPKAVVVPHAGHVYSGPTAALAYDLLARRRADIRRVVLLGPCHRVWEPGVAESGASAFETPLGSVPVEQLDADTRARFPWLHTHAATHAEEHSLEVQLPFLQMVLGEFTLVPLVVGGATPDQVADLLDALWGGPETVVVVSSDLSHYLPHDRAVAVDSDTVDRIVALDGPLESERACGAAPVNGLLVAARRHGLTPTLLGRCTSGDPNVLRSDVDPRRVVGYAAVSFA